MEDFIDSIGQTRSKQKTLKALSRLLSGCLNNDDKIRKGTWVNEIPIAGHALLLHLGFTKGDGVWECPSQTGSSRDQISEANELIECVLMSMDDDEEDGEDAAKNGASSPNNASAAAGAASGAGGPDQMDVDSKEEDDEELNAALAMSLGDEGARVHKKQKTDDDDDMPAANEVRVDVEFQRFDASTVTVDPKQVDEVNAIQEAIGEPYVDPQFPASDKALYINPEDAKTWDCMTCGRRNPLPPLFPFPPDSREEAMNLQQKLDSILCFHCRAKPTNVAQVRFVHRPSNWLRPGGRTDSITDMLYPTVTDMSIKSRLCTGFIRDDMGNTIGQEWAVVREEARPEDVVQGAIGNCWFAGALSVVAQRPDLIDKLILTKKYNKHGAYLVRLCHAGRWRGMLLDDLFPCSKVWDGRLADGKIYFARGGELSYLQSRRRQLWVPLIEKAAAKLFGCYGALNSGTFGEALGLLTGYPVEQMRLYEPKSVKDAREKRRNEIVALRTQALFRGEEPPDVDEEEMSVLDDAFQVDVLWTRLLSYFEAGYIMGLACSHEGVEKSRDEVVGVGLQSPHAYGILDVREIEYEWPKNSGNKRQRLIKVRNPWGDKAPQTWKGAWGTDWEGWTFDLKLQLGVVNRSNVTLHETMGIFWISFEDLRKYFGSVEVCRVHPPYWCLREERLWLSSAVGPGECLEFDVYQATEIDLAVWQERHVKRETAIGAKSTNQDVGFALFRCQHAKAEAKEIENKYELHFLHRGKRTRQDQTSVDITLEGGYTYLVVLFSFSLLREENAFPRQGSLVLHANHKVSELRKVGSSWPLIGRALWSVLDAEVTRRVPLQCQMTQRVFKDVKTCFMRDGDAGYIMAVENHSSTDTAGVQYDMTESIGIQGSRASAVTFDVVPPRHKFIVNVGTQTSKADFVDYQQGMQYVDPEMAMAMMAPQEDFHIVLPLEEKCDAKKKAPPSAEFLALGEGDAVYNGFSRETLKQQYGDKYLPRSSSKNLPGGGSSSSYSTTVTAPASTKQAETAASLAGDITVDADDEEARLLEQAMQLSVDPKVTLQTRVKTLFEQYTKEGMPPNEAAAQAMRVAKEQMLHS
ncbi:unnamed protein product [Amoebophrya sp. A25]|nr:unnamed protein product [Amoebophrya sp. A25]|eukprot:GSA25T00021214001.1